MWTPWWTLGLLIVEGANYEQAILPLEEDDAIRRSFFTETIEVGHILRPP